MSSTNLNHHHQSPSSSFSSLASADQQQLNSIFYNHWWQLFDTRSKRFYYYNIRLNKCSWQRPATVHNNNNNENTQSIIPLASKLIQCSSEQISNNISFIEKLKQKIQQKEPDTTQFKKRLEFLIKNSDLEALLNTKNEKENNAIVNVTHQQLLSASAASSPVKSKIATNGAGEGTTSIASNKLASCSYSSLASTQSQQRRLQPRTNPNYINVDLIDNQDGRFIRNTYVKLGTSDLNSKPQKETPESSKRINFLFKVLQPDQPQSQQEHDDFIYFDEDPDTTDSFSTISTSCAPPIPKETTKEQTSSNNLISSYSSSLSRKFQSKVEKPQQQQETEQISMSSSSFETKQSTPKQNYFNRFLLINKNSEKKQQQQQLLNSPSSTSLADINNIQQSQSTPQQQRYMFNQRLQTLKRSFNKKSTSSSAFTQRNKTTTITQQSSFIQDNNNVPSPPSGGCIRNTDMSYLSELLHFDSLSKPKIDKVVDGSKNNKRQPVFPQNLIDLNIHHVYTNNSKEHEEGVVKKRSNFLFFTSTTTTSGTSTIPTRRKKTKQHLTSEELMLWSCDTLQKSLMKTNDKIVKKEAVEIFKLIQCYMGDRKITTPMGVTQRDEQNEATVNDFICLELMHKGWCYTQLRDELYLQLIKQTTCNQNRSSLLLGWQLIAISLTFFPPSLKLFPFLNEYIIYHTKEEEEEEEVEDQDQEKDLKKSKLQLYKIARASLKRLERIHLTGAKKGLKKPTLEEILLSKNTLTSPSLFGTTLEEIMQVQKKKWPQLQLPWIQTTLSEAVLRLNGAKTEGIFRVPGDLDEVNNLKVKYDNLWCSKKQSDDQEEEDIDLMATVEDAHLPASLLKLWYRELYEPLIPSEFYDECIQHCENVNKCIELIERLPSINRLVFTYLIRFLKVFAAAENVEMTKMDANNLSMIMAPNCLRCRSNEPKVIMENTKKEMMFLKTLIKNLDTSLVQGII